jgi:hypothetical protein
MINIKKGTDIIFRRIEYRPISYPGLDHDNGSFATVASVCPAVQENAYGILYKHFGIK